MSVSNQMWDRFWSKIESRSTRLGDVFPSLPACGERDGERGSTSFGTSRSDEKRQGWLRETNSWTPLPNPLPASRGEGIEPLRQSGFSEIQPSLRAEGPSGATPGVKTPGLGRSSLRDGGLPITGFGIRTALGAAFCASLVLSFAAVAQPVVDNAPDPAVAPPPMAEAQVTQNGNVYVSGVGSFQFERYGQPRPVIFSDFNLDEGTTNYGDVVVIRGNGKIGGKVEGNMITVLGDATINGTVTRDVQVIMGSLTLGPQARVGGNVVVVGGNLDRAPGSRINQEVDVILGNNPVFKGATDWLSQGLVLGRPFPPNLPWVWVIAGICLLVNLLLLLIFPRPIEACVTTMESKALTSLLVGVLAKLLIGLFVILLAVSMVGLIAVPFIGAGYFVATLLGKVTTYRYVGWQLGKLTGGGALQGPLAGLLLGTALFYALYMVPYLGFLAYGFAGLFGFGAVVLATFRQFRSERRAASTFAPGPAAAGAENPAAAGGSPFGAASPFGAGSPFAGGAPPHHAAAEMSALARTGFWMRLLATALDVALFLITFGIFIHPRNMDRDFLGLDWWDITLILWLVYHVCFWKWRGTTIGGIILGIKVVRVDGRPLDVPVALVRALSSVLSFFVLGLGFFWAGFSRDKQSWHDIIAGTVMVKVPRGMSLV